MEHEERLYGVVEVLLELTLLGARVGTDGGCDC